MARPKKGITFWDRVTSQLKLTRENCHEFTGHKDECGYGRIRGPNNRGLLRLHRAKWELYYGDISPNKIILHKCDNPACININHLFVGTQLDNMRDRKMKGRYAFRVSERIKSDVPAVVNNRRRKVLVADEYGIVEEVESRC